MKKLINGWRKIEGDQLPELIFNAIKSNNGFRYGQWIDGFVKDNKFIVVTNDGGYYKVHAKFMIWNSYGENQEKVSSEAIWNKKDLMVRLNDLFSESGRFSMTCAEYT